MGARLNRIQKKKLLHFRFRSHGWEQQHFLDREVISEHHGKAVNTQAPSGSWRQTIFQRGTEVLVMDHGLVITRSLRSHYTSLFPRY